MPKPIEFYFDFSSPYAYFAADKIDDVAMEFGGREVVWKPFLLGVAMQTTKNEPLAHQPMKGDYSQMDWDRLARFMKVPWQMPQKFPIASLGAARAYYFLFDQDQKLAKDFARACFVAFFAEGRDITKTTILCEIGAALGVDANELAEALTDARVKDRLKEETQAAVDAGVFGSPFFIVDEEKFWGSDRIWMIKRWLKTGGW